MLSVIIIFAAHIEDKPSTKSAFASVLQMFTHVSPSPFVSGQNPAKDAKISLSWSEFARCVYLGIQNATWGGEFVSNGIV
jgi:hypothetical protein